MKSKEKPKYNMWQSVRYMLGLAWKHKKGVIGMSLLLAAIAVCLNLVQLYAAPSILSRLEDQASVGELLITIIGFSLMLFVLTSAQTYFSESSVTDRIYIRIEIIKSIVRKSCTTSYPNRKNPTVLKLLEGAHCASDSNHVGCEHIWKTLTNLITNIAGFAIYLVLLSDLNGFLAAVVILTTVVGFFVSKHINEWEYRNKDEKHKYFAQMQYTWTKAESMEFAKDIRVFGMKDWIADMYSSAARLFEAFIYRREKVFIWANIVDVILNIARNGIAYVYLIHLTLNQGLTASEFLLYFGAVSGFTSWVTGILSEVSTMHRETLEISTVLEYIHYPELFRFEGGKPVPASDAYELRLEDVTFRYPGSDTNLFEHLNLTIHPGEKLAIVGLNGAGKTTLVKLLCGFYDPTEGRVLLNGTDIRELNRQEYYGLLSAVFQDYSVMDLTVAENVTLESGNYDEVRIHSCLEKAGLADYIAGLPQGIYTHMGRDVFLDGVLFSGGQTQRLMLARALYKDGPILILDEPTAALDPIAENDIYRKYNEMTQGKTSVFISHRLASTRFCDRIIFVADGRIAEEGTHSSLLALGGKYANLFEVQSRYYQEGRDFRGE